MTFCEDQKERIREPELQKGPASVHDLDHYANACSHAGRLQVGQQVDTRFFTCAMEKPDTYSVIIRQI